MTEKNFLSIILAAGKGTRMKSKLPKALHKVGDKSMIQHVIDAARGAQASKQIVITGFEADMIKTAVGAQAECVFQEEQLGTGHAVKTAKEKISAFDGSTIMVLCCDTPLLTASLLAQLYEHHISSNAKATILTALAPDPTGYGRIIRDSNDLVSKIVEHKDASSLELQVNEINTGIYCFEKNELLEALDSLTCNNANKEYYLTDVIGMFRNKNLPVVSTISPCFEETLGINSRLQLAEAEKFFNRRKLLSLLDDGVTILDLDSVFISPEATIGQDTIIHPFTFIEGNTVIGSNCQIGPNTKIDNSFIGDGVYIYFSYLNECKIKNNVKVGPYVQIRPDSVLEDNAKIGNFVEIKNSIIGEDSKVPHLSYIGDTDMGKKVNIGSGTITVNYDGKNKSRTTIKDMAFIGCNCNLIAPVVIEEGAFIGAGSTITKNVTAWSLAVERSNLKCIKDWRKPK